MIIELASLGTTAKRVEVDFDPANIDLEGEFVQTRGKTELRGDIELVDAKAVLTGTIRTHLLIDCTRCLDSFEREQELPFRAIFVDPGAEDTSVEAEVGGDELDESLAPNGQIDLVEVVREQILLAVPIQNFCREDCHGLCPKCGSNLNLIDCKCVEEDIDPRWAALKSFK